ncbi:MAG: hypothetical protein RL207_1173 [Bacteroidota bacterium]|jgi:hypothetical protein
MNKILLVIGLLNLSFSACTQVFVTLPVNFDSSVGYHDTYNSANQNYGNAAFSAAFQIPGYHGGVNTNRGLIAFDLSGIPVGSTVISAKLNLFAYTDFTVVALQDGHCGNNQSKLSRVTSNWSESTVTWNTQPTVSSLHETVLNQSLAQDQDYLNINVSSLVQDMVNNPTTSFGFRLALVDEVVTSSLAFCSQEFANPAKRPTLFVEYRLPASSVSEFTNEKFLIYPNPAQNMLHLSFPNAAPNRRITCVDIQGKRVVEVTNDDQELDLDLSSMASGIYTIFVEESSVVYPAKKFYKN